MIRRTHDSVHAEWRDEARCKVEIDNYPDLLGAWDGPNEDGVSHPLAEIAAEICVKKCAVREQCLRAALSNPEAQGTRGGYTFDGGKVPVAIAREIRDTMDLQPGAHQSVGRPKKAKTSGESKYL